MKMEYEDCKVGQQVIVNKNATTEELINHIAVIVRIATKNIGMGCSIRVCFTDTLPGIEMHDYAKDCMAGDGFGFRPQSLDPYMNTNRQATKFLLKR
jgi:hypothetical protein